MAELADLLRCAVHLCLDMQNLFDVGGPWPTPWMPRVLPKVVQLAACSPERTVFTRFITPYPSESLPGLWRVYYEKWPQVRRGVVADALLDLRPELAHFAPPAKVFDKRVYSAFADGRLHAFLRRRQIDTLIVTGSETDVCVLSSALAAVDLGYRIVIARDAVCSSSDEAHDALIRLYERRFAVQIEIANTQDIVAAWSRHLP